MSKTQDQLFTSCPSVQNAPHLGYRLGLEADKAHMRLQRLPPSIEACQEPVRGHAAAVDVSRLRAVAALELPCSTTLQQQRRRAACGAPQRVVCIYTAANQDRPQPNLYSRLQC